MVIKHIVIIILLFFIIGSAIYYYYQDDPSAAGLFRRNDHPSYRMNMSRNVNPIMNNNSYCSPGDSSCRRETPGKKKVRFNDEVDMKTFDPLKPSFAKIPFNDNKSAWQNMNEFNPRKRIGDGFDFGTRTRDDGPNSGYDNNFNPKPISAASNSIMVDEEDGNWDDLFKTDIMAKIPLSAYETPNTARMTIDKNIIIEPETKIQRHKKIQKNPLLSLTKYDRDIPKEFVGVSIKDIYDQKTQGPKAIPKILKSSSENKWEYEKESELNGGALRDSSLFGYEKLDQIDMYKGLSYDDEFAAPQYVPFDDNTIYNI